MSEIGHGGMGIVYRCFDEVSGKDVALKMLPPEVAHDTAEMDSVRENYGLVEGLHHPNIATLKQLDPVPDTQDFALVMEVHLRAARASPADRGQDRRRPVVLRAAGVAGLESPQGGDEHAYFWATHGGAEMDLCVMRGATRIGMEFKHTSAPALTRSMAIARTDLRLRRVYVVHPGDRTFALDDRTVAVGLNVLAARLKEDGVGKG